MHQRLFASDTAERSQKNIREKRKKPQNTIEHKALYSIRLPRLADTSRWWFTWQEPYPERFPRGPIIRAPPTVTFTTKGRSLPKNNSSKGSGFKASKHMSNDQMWTPGAGAKDFQLESGWPISDFLGTKV